MCSLDPLSSKKSSIWTQTVQKRKYGIAFAEEKLNKDGRYDKCVLVISSVENVHREH